MTPIVYISGKYRHYNRDGSLDRDPMADEVEDEKRWAAVVARAGCIPFAPLAATMMLEDQLTAEQFIANDLEIIRRLRPGYDCILMRRGWGTSVGANMELVEAEQRKLRVMFAENGEQHVLNRLRDLAQQKATVTP